MEKMNEKKSLWLQLRPLHPLKPSQSKPRKTRIYYLII